MTRLRLLLPALLLALPASALAQDGKDALVAMVALSSTFGSVVAVVGIVMYAGYRARRLRHETIRLAMEKGQPLPPGLLDPAPRPQDRGARDLRLGVMLVALGIGLAICLGALSEWQVSGPWSIGVVPGLLGAGYLVTWAVLGRRGAGEVSGDVPAGNG